LQTKQKISIDNKNQLDVSIIIPVYNEVENVELLAKSIAGILSEYSLEYEVIFIDDGSTDGTVKVLKKLHKTVNGVKVILFRSNFGQSAALAAGFERALGIAGGVPAKVVRRRI